MASPERQFDMTGALDLELQAMGPIPPSSLPASESQHPGPTALLTWKGFSNIVRKALPIPGPPKVRDHDSELLAVSKLHSERPQFWEDYIHLRHRPCAPLQSLFHLMGKNKLEHGGVIGWECHLRYKGCLSDWLEEIHQRLVRQRPDSLVLWWDSWLFPIFELRRLKMIRSSLTAEIPNSNSGFLYRTFKSLPSRANRRREVPRRALMYLLSQRKDWHLPQNAVEELAEADAPSEIEQYQGLPSEST